MQILESTMFGLRSARLSLRQRDTGIQVTLFPMVHVGDRKFYESVSEDALKHHAILFEGLRSNKMRSLTASYRWLDLDRLGLVVQPRLDEEAAQRAGARLVHADISENAAEELWSDMPLWLRVLLSIGAPIFGAYQRLFATRESVAEGMSRDLLRSRKSILEDGDEYQPIRDLLQGARDERLIQVLQKEILDAAYGTRFAVIYGAAHIPPLVRHLIGFGFVTQPAEWMTIIKID